MKCFDSFSSYAYAFRNDYNENLIYRTLINACILPYAGETTLSVLGRIVLFIWMFVILIVKSSYTASLGSKQTVQNLYSPVKGIETLM